MPVAGRAQLERIAAEHGVRVVSDGIRIRCPIHQGKSPSLTIKLFRDGFLLAKCWGGGCDRIDLDKVLGIGVSKDPPPRCGVGGCRSGLDSRVAVYHNPKVAGEEICSHRVDFVSGSDCWYDDCANPQPHKHLWGKGTHSGALLLAWGEDDPASEVVLVEGEKAADVLAGHVMNEPYCPHTWRGGAESVCVGDWAALAGRKVIIWPDADDSGRVAGARAVQKAFDAGALQVRLVCVQGLPDKADAADVDAAASLSLLRAAQPESRPHPTTPAQSNGAIARPDTRSPMSAREIDIASDVQRAWAHLLDKNTARDGHFIYRRRNRPIVIGGWQAGLERKVRIEDLDSEGLLLRTSRVIFWNTQSGDSVRAALPPSRFGILMLKDVPDALPELDRAVQWPLLTPTGFIERDGYNSDVQVYMQCPPGLNCDMSIDDALGAWGDLIVDFPFEAESDRAAALAAALSPLIRPVAPLAPLVAYLKPESGTGATLLATVSASIIEGEPPPTRPPLTTDHDESLKALLTYASEAVCFILLDNQQQLDHPGLAAMLTTREFSGRRLGTNESLEVSNSRYQIMVTANNLSMTKELMNRTFAIRLDAQVPNPSSRTGFVHADLVQFARENRVFLLSALGSLVKAWHVAGRPPGPANQSLGAFSSWRDVMCGILHHAGIRGFLKNLDSVRSRAQDGHLDGQSFVSAWHDTFETNSVGTRELHGVALPVDGEPLLKLRGADRVGLQGQKIRLGDWLAQNARRRFYGPDGSYLSINPAGSYRRAKQYRLEVEMPPPAPPPVRPEAQADPPPETRECPVCGRDVGDAQKDEFGQCLDLSDCERTRAENESNTQTRFESEASQPSLEVPANRTH